MIRRPPRSEEHTSELQSNDNLVCRLLLVKKDYCGFNTFINFPVFSVLLDPLNMIPSFFHTSGLEYPARGGIQHLLVLMRKPGIKVCKYNFLGELMVWAFEHQ